MKIGLFLQLFRTLKVITLNEEDFRKACRSLARQIKISFKPDLIVAIPRGGLDVYLNMKDDFSIVPYIECAISRPSTDVKKKINLKKLFKYIPYFFLDFMRRIEAFIREGQSLGRKEKNKKNIELMCQGNENIKNILIIDDAVDSGSTMKLVRDAVAAKFPNAEIKTAALVVTFVKPIIYPDYYAHKSCLLRFPWSEDFK